jgi:hypothetical protein
VRAQSTRAQSTSVDLRLREGTNIAAAVSPDGRTIAFDLIGRIWDEMTGRVDSARPPLYSDNPRPVRTS